MLIRENYKVCPLRLILRIFEAKAILQETLQDAIFITPEEIYTLVNNQELRSKICPTIQEVINVLRRYYDGQIPMVQGEKRFAFLEPTGLFKVETNNNLILYPYNDFVLNHNRNIQIDAIKSFNP